jgi:outer membrane protein TolC
LDLQAARKMVVFYDAYEKSRQQFFDLIQEKVSLGASSQLDLVRARTKLLEAKANIPSISAELFRAESRVQEFFSAVPDFAFAFYRLPDIPINFGGNIDELVSRHPAILEAAQNVALVRKEMEFLRNASFGRLSFKLSVTDTRQPVVGHSNTSSGFIEYSNTLFDGFSRRARIATLGERVVELQVEQERIERKLRQQLLATLSEFQSAKDTLEVREQLLLSARKSAKDQYTAFLLNRGSLTDIFDAEESYFTAAESTLDAIANLHRAYYKMLYDAGQLSEAFELNS